MCSQLRKGIWPLLFKMPAMSLFIDHLRARNGKLLMPLGADALPEAQIMMFERWIAAGSPEKAHAACLLDDGRRTWANVTDLDTVGAMMREEFCGRSGTIDGDGGLTIN